MPDDLFLPYTGSDPLAELMADAPPPPAKGHGAYSLTWLAWALPPIRTSTQLAVALLIYRECFTRRSNTVALSNHELRKIGISRYAKYRALAQLRAAGIITIEGTNTKRLLRVTLLRFP